MHETVSLDTLLTIWNVCLRWNEARIVAFDRTCASLNRADNPRRVTTPCLNHASYYESGYRSPLLLEKPAEFNRASHDFASQSFSKVITGDFQH